MCYVNRGEPLTGHPSMSQNIAPISICLPLSPELTDMAGVHVYSILIGTSMRHRSFDIRGGGGGGGGAFTLWGKNKVYLRIGKMNNLSLNIWKIDNLRNSL